MRVDWVKLCEVGQWLVVLDVDEMGIGKGIRRSKGQERGKC